MYWRSSSSLDLNIMKNRGPKMIVIVCNKTALYYSKTCDNDHIYNLTTSLHWPIFVRMGLIVLTLYILSTMTTCIQWLKSFRTLGGQCTQILL